MQKALLSRAITLALIAVLGLTGCRSGRWPWQRSRAGTQTSSTEPPPLSPGEGYTTAARPVLGGAEVHGQFVPIYFDYDSARIRPGEMSRLETVAAALKGNFKTLVIEGHTDERGTAEYNRALGERRAQAAREELVRLGIDASRITTISYGKDRPAEMGHDDTSWSKNRRCEFVMVGQ